MAFPIVPIAPGVPPLLRDPSSIVPGIALTTVDTLGASLFGTGQWGLFKFGVPVILADSVFSFSYRQDWVISDYPLELGAFESYDKVQIPFVARLRFLAGGDTLNKQKLLTSIALVAGTTVLFDAVTPEAVYLNTNVAHYDYNRAAERGVGLLAVDVWLVEARVNANTAFSNVALPGSAAVTNGGGVDGIAPTTGQTTAALGSGSPINSSFNASGAI